MLLDQQTTVGPDGVGKPVELEKQGSFSAGGVVITGTNGDTFHGDAAYVEFQIPHHARDLPLVMWHGGGQFSKTWESTPDGRDGYQQIFTRRRFSSTSSINHDGEMPVGQRLARPYPMGHREKRFSSASSAWASGTRPTPEHTSRMRNFLKTRRHWINMSCSRRPTPVPKISTNRRAFWKARQWRIFSRKSREAFS
jgi:hypothetical protein